MADNCSYPGAAGRRRSPEGWDCRPRCRTGWALYPTVRAQAHRPRHRRARSRLPSLSRPASDPRAARPWAADLEAEAAAEEVAAAARRRRLRPGPVPHPAPEVGEGPLDSSLSKPAKAPAFSLPRQIPPARKMAPPLFPVQHFSATPDVFCLRVQGRRRPGGGRLPSGAETGRSCQSVAADSRPRCTGGTIGKMAGFWQIATRP